MKKKLKRIYKSIKIKLEKLFKFSEFDYNNN